ncbi:PREDICTED: zinc finger protein 469 [Elephantulus edwardii]|uniref:zinc finger protein 469 n=1 Tax=Elephantulus edwardii TaxID=28737 RepID=UPI0003F0E9A2|nr:PREDICTED: zinc finger protein 469 [Elephantulus edwardii]
MPGEQSLGAPVPTTTGCLQIRLASHDSGRPSRPPIEDSTRACRTTKDTREVGSGARASEPPKDPPEQASEVCPRALSNSWSSGKAPRGSLGKGPVQARARRPGRGQGSVQQLYRLSIASTKDKRAPDKAPQGSGASLTPSLPGPEAQPVADQLFQRCFPETPTRFTSTDYTSPSPTPQTPALQRPKTQGPSPSRPASYIEFPAGRAASWPPNTNNFPAANFRVPPTEPESFPEGDGPSPSSRAVTFQYPFPVDTAQREFTSNEAVALALRLSADMWPEQPAGTSSAYALSAQPPAPLLPCYRRPTGSLKVPHNLGGSLSPPGATHPAPGPFPASLHQSLCPALPERPPSAHERAGSPRGPPNPPPMRHFLSKAFLNSPGDSAVGSSSGPLDKELVAPSCTPGPQPQLWEGASEALPLVDPTVGAYPTAPPAPPVARGAFFEGQRLCLPHSPTLPWPPRPAPTGPGPTPMELLNRLPYPISSPEWPGSGHTPGPVEKLTMPQNGQGTPSSPPGLFPYGGLQDAGTQPLFFGVTPHQASPLGTPGLPPSRGVGVSPSESPLPSPATTAAGSGSCSSLSPLSSSPANPSSEEGQLPGLPGSAAFFQPSCPQEASGAFPPAEPPPAIRVHYQPEPPKAFSFPADTLGTSGAFECPALGTFPQEPPPYSAHHFPLSSASLDQLDVLLTCRQCDRNYSSLASFLQHRQFCSLLPRAPEGLPRPPTPRVPAEAHPPSSLGPTKLAGFLLDGDVLHSLASAPLPLPASDLDLEDVAKLDSLITEALNGLQDPSDTPEIDSSFIDVFADEDPLGPRGPGTGPLPKPRARVTPEPSVQALLPDRDPAPQPRAPSPGAAEGCPPCSTPGTCSRGPGVPRADEGGGPTGRPRRGKRLQVFQEGLITAQGPRASSKTACLRPRRKGSHVEQPLPQVRELRGHADSGGQAPITSPPPMQTRSSQRPSRSRHARRRARGGRWSKELIHKIVQQKNDQHQRASRGRGARGCLLAARLPPSPRADSCGSASAEDKGAVAPPGRRQQATRGRPHLSSRGQKRKVAGGTPGPREERGQQMPKRLVRQDPGMEGVSLTETEGFSRGAGTEAPEEDQPPPHCSPETKLGAGTPEVPPAPTTPHQEVLGDPSAAEQPQPGLEDCRPSQPPSQAHHKPRLTDSPSAGTDNRPLFAPDQAAPSKPRPGKLPVLSATAGHATHPAPAALLLENPGLVLEPPDCHGALLGVPASQKGPQPCRSVPTGLLLRHKELGSEDPAPRPRAPNGPGSHVGLRLEPHRNVPCPAERGLSSPQPLLTLESTLLFGRPPEDRFDPTVYDSLLEHRDDQTPLTCAGPSPPRPLLENWPLLEDEAAGLPSHVVHFSRFPQEKPCGQRCPSKEPAVPTPPLPPGNSHRCTEEELEIQRLVTELKSQLRTSTARRPVRRPAPDPLDTGPTGATCPQKDAHQVPMPLDTGPTGATCPQRDTHEVPTPLDTGPTGASCPQKDTHQAPVPPTSPATMPQEDALVQEDLKRSSPQQDSEGVVAPHKGALESPLGVWTLALQPEVQEDVGPTAPFSPLRTRGRTHPTPKMDGVQRTAPAQTEREGGVLTGATVPSPTKLLRLDADSITERSPDPAPQFPRWKETTRTWSSGGALLLQPHKCRENLSPEPLKTGVPSQGFPKSGECGSPTAHPEPGVAGQAVGGLLLGTRPHLGALQEHSVGNSGSKPMDTQPIAVTHPVCVLKVGSEQSPQPPAPSPQPPAPSPQPQIPSPQPQTSSPQPQTSSPQPPGPSPLYQLQLLVARAVKHEDMTQHPQHSEPTGQGGDNAGSKTVACGQAQGSKGNVQAPAGPTDGHPGSLGQAQSWAPETRGQGQVSHLQPEEQEALGELGDLITVEAGPGAAPDMPPEGMDRVQEQLEKGDTAWSLQCEAGDPSHPTSIHREASAVDLVTAPNGHDVEPAGKVASQGLGKQLLSAEGSPWCPIPDPVPHTPCSVSAASLRSCSPKDLPNEVPPSVPAGTPGAQGEQGEQLPTSPSCEEPPNPQHPAPSQPQASIQRASCGPSAISAGAEQCPATPPPGRTSLCNLQLDMVDSSPLVDTLTGDQTDPDITSTCSDGNISRTLGGLGNPANVYPSPPAGPVTPRGAGKASEHPHIPAASDTEVTGELGTPDPRVSSSGLCWPLSGPARGTVYPGPGEDQRVTAKAMDTCPAQATRPDAHSCLGLGASSQNWEGPGSPGVGHSISQSDWHTRRPPQSDSNTPHPAPRGDPVCPHDAEQTLPDFPKKPRLSGRSQRLKGPSPAACPDVTCDICGASFRSGPGLSRHKARKHRGGASPPHQTGLHNCGAPNPTACTPQVSREKSCPAPGTEKPKARRKASDQGPARARLEAEAAGPRRLQAANSEPLAPRPPSRVTPRTPRSSKSHKPTELVVPRGAQRQGREPGCLLSDSGALSDRKGRRAGTRRFQKSGASVSEDPPDVIPDRTVSNPSNVIANYPARPNLLSTEQEQELPREQPLIATPRDAAEAGVLSLEEGTATLQAGKEAASEFWGPRDLQIVGTETELSQAEASRWDTGRAGGGVVGNPEPSLESLDAPRTLDCDPQDFSEPPEAGGLAQCLQGIPSATSPGLSGAQSDREVRIIQLSPPSDHMSQKRARRAHGQHGKKSEPPLPPELPGQAGGSTLSSSVYPPTEPRDHGSLRLSPEEPWVDGAPGLPEDFLTRNFLCGSVPGAKAWAPSPSLWAAEHPERRPNPSEEMPPSPHVVELSEGLPELHRVPASWRGLQEAAEETPCSLGDMSPEPPSLEREGLVSGPSGNTGLTQLPTLNLDMLSARFEMQDLCLLGPCQDPGGLPRTTFLDVHTGVNVQETPGPRPEDAGGGPGRDRTARGKRGTYKCRVCFRRFGGLGELDVHKLAHSPAPPPTCYMCVERRFGSRQLLREHLREKHAQGAAGLWACGMCLRQVPDVWMYNEHLREHAVRFARRGQALTTLGDRPDRDHGVTPEASGDPKDAPRGTTAESKAPSTNPPNQGGTLPADSDSTRAPPSLSPNAWPLSEVLPRGTPVHMDCKDSSRHCHHCGKQFPKPCKLQRHLVVHSPQRVFLCPQCPGVYSEHGQLLAHRRQEHGASGEPERPATPLYSCALCATVMRIIKRAFVCSTCNYTFSKKEQFDRHMDKHRRPGQQPFTFRRVRRPGARGHKAPLLEDMQPSKRLRVARVVSSSPGPGVDKPQCQGSSPSPGTVSPATLLAPCPEPAPSTAQGQPQERPMDTQGHPGTAGDPPPDCWALPPLPLSPSPAPQAGGEGRLEDEVPPGSPSPLCPLTVQWAGNGNTEEKMGPLLSSGKLRTPSVPSKGPPAQRKKQVPRSQKVPKERPSHKSGTAKAGGSRARSEGRPAVCTPSKVPAVLVPLGKAVQNLHPPEPAQDPEDRPGSTTTKAMPDPSSQGTGGPQHSVTEEGGSQPQLVSENAPSPAKSPCLDQSLPPAKPPPQAPAKCPSQGPQESRGASGGKRRGRAPGPPRSDSTRSLGSTTLVPVRPPRNPRKQAAPSRVPPIKPRLSSQADKPPLLQPAEGRRGPPSHSLGGVRRRREGMGMAAPEKRPLHGPARKGRALPVCPRTLHTAEAQSHVLSQLFGQRLTGFKIPLKREPTE